MRDSLRSAGLSGLLVCLSVTSGCAAAPAVEQATAVPTNSVGTTIPPASVDASASPSAAAASATDLSGRTIVIDPGHTGGWTSKWGTQKVPNGIGGTKPCNSSGTATNGGYSEHAYNLAQAQALAEALEARGATVRLTRTDDSTASADLCVNHRADLANELQADVLISIHADGNTGKSNRGFHLIVSPSMKGGTAVEDKSEALAVDLRTKLESGTAMPRSNYIGKGTALSVRSDLGTLNFAKRPAVMLEMGNMMNVTDAALLPSASFRTQAAQALAAGIAQYLG
jgi:N-acetylmuramoyl-L-alanine amidase